MSINEFGVLVKSIHEKVMQVEIAHLFRHFDTTNKGFIAKDEFIARFSEETKEQAFQIGIEDIIKPLATKCMKSNINLGNLFDRYDKNKNMRLSAEELSEALR